MIIKSIKLVDLKFNVNNLEPAEDGTIFIGLQAKINTKVKKLDNGNFYLTASFELDMGNEEPSENSKRENGLYVTYGVYVESIENEGEFNDLEQEMILMQLQPYFDQKVNNLFSESRMRAPHIPINFWKISEED